MGRILVVGGGAMAMAVWDNTVDLMGWERAGLLAENEQELTYLVMELWFVELKQRVTACICQQTETGPDSNDIRAHTHFANAQIIQIK